MSEHVIEPELTDAITRACAERAGQPLPGGQELRFRCPAPDHPDRHPSARWHADKGVWHCDACGAGGGATDLARLLGVPLGGGYPTPQPPPHLTSSFGLVAGEGEQVHPGGTGALQRDLRSPSPSAEGEGLGWGSPPPSTPDLVARQVVAYPYGPGRRVVRYMPKTFRPQHLVGERWQLGRGPGVWPLYREDQLPADRSVPVHVTEGEKDAEALAALGWCAVTPGSSATPWQREWTEVLAGRPIVIHADNDPPGDKRAVAIARTLAPAATAVRMVTYAGFGPGGDVSDFLARHDGTALRNRVASIRPWVDRDADPDDDPDPSGPVAAPAPRPPLRPEPATAPWLRIGPASTDPAHQPRPTGLPAPRPWPELPPEARHGLAGDILDVIAPQTEADPAALLVTLLVLFGAAVGPGPYMEVSGGRHAANLFAVVVGETAKARKGTSRAYPERLLTGADDAFAARIASGALSGEGVVWAIRDPITVTRKGKEVTEDAGVDDKRLCVFEEEFSGVIKVMLREGNTVSETLRRSWDGRALGGLAKNQPARCERPHVALMGHVTKHELERVLTQTEQANGFANRILWTCARRARLLPEGGHVDPATLAGLSWRLRGRLATARRHAELRRDDEARVLWGHIYERLSTPDPGLMGALTARSEAHVLRLSLVYALLDGAGVIRADHLLAATAVWDYCAASAHYVFGDRLGNPVADRILEALAHGPLTRSEIRDVLGRNAKSHAVAAALAELTDAGKATMRADTTGPGRPAEIWELAQGT